MASPLAFIPILEMLGRPTRRQLLSWSALTGISLALLSRRSFAAPAASDGSLSAAPLALDPKSYRTLEAVTARILPSDAGPGAREAEVIRFIDRQLAGELRAILPAMTTCAALLDQWAEKKYSGQLYINLNAGAQDGVIENLSRGEIPAPTIPQRELYSALHTLTLEGFLADPSHGGNDQMIGWRALGITPMHRRTKAEAVEEDPAPAPRRKHPLRIVE